MTTPNWRNRTLWTGDNLDIMRGMNSESVDLIYLDPPFNSNRNYAAPIGSEAAGAAFKDTWTLSDVDEAWHGEIADRMPSLYAIIDAAGLAHGKGMKSYLIMMAVRLMEMQRLLKDSGSLYLHCDPIASHSGRIIFGVKSFGSGPVPIAMPGKDGGNMDVFMMCCFFTRRPANGYGTPNTLRMTKSTLGSFIATLKRAQGEDIP